MASEVKPRQNRAQVRRTQLAGSTRRLTSLGEPDNLSARRVIVLLRHSCLRQSTALCLFHSTNDDHAIKVPRYDRLLDRAKGASGYCPNFAGACHMTPVRLFGAATHRSQRALRQSKRVKLRLLTFGPPVRTASGTPKPKVRNQSPHRRGSLILPLAREQNNAVCRPRLPRSRPSGQKPRPNSP
jgi:hypothetical protein